MATRKKSGAAAPAQQHTLFEKIGGQAIHLKNEIVAGTDHLLEAAGDKIAAVTTSIKEFAAKKKAATKKLARKVAKKPAAKKAAPKRQAAKKKSAPKKAAPAAKKAGTRKTAKKKAAPKKAAKAAKSITVLRKRSRR